jgi:hypothetical protein
MQAPDPRRGSLTLFTGAVASRAAAEASAPHERGRLRADARVPTGPEGSGRRSGAAESSRLGRNEKPYRLAPIGITGRAGDRCHCLRPGGVTARASVGTPAARPSRSTAGPGRLRSIAPRPGLQARPLPRGRSG